MNRRVFLSSAGIVTMRDFLRAAAAAVGDAEAAAPGPFEIVVKESY